MTTYWIEVWEQKKDKMAWHVVSHNFKYKWYEFIGRSEAKKFLDELRQNNPASQFRMMKQTKSSKVTPIKI